MGRIRESWRNHRKAWFGLWILGLVGLVGGLQWHTGGREPVRTQVLGASTSIPPAPSITSGPAEGQPVASTSVTFGYTDSENGVQFQCQLDSAAFTGCGKSSVAYSGLGAGTHTFSVEAQKGNGPWSLPAIRHWTVVLAPPTPTIKATPPASTIQPDATFTFTDTQAGVGFQCKLDSGASAACASPVVYEGLAAGSHTFSVQAVNGPAISAAATYGWTITSASFGISGDLTQALYPGVTVPLNLTFTNPYNNAHGINVSGITVTVQHGTVKNGVANAGCDGPANVTVAAPAGSAWPVNVPRNATRSLSDLGVPQGQWPQVTMRDLPTNQDGCKNTTFKFSYTGTATK